MNCTAFFICFILFNIDSCSIVSSELDLQINPAYGSSIARIVIIESFHIILFSC
jgi:hypothetical protein